VREILVGEVFTKKKKKLHYLHQRAVVIRRKLKLNRQKVKSFFFFGFKGYQGTLQVRKSLKKATRIFTRVFFTVRSK